MGYYKVRPPTLKGLFGWVKGKENEEMYIMGLL